MFLTERDLTLLHCDQCGRLIPLPATHTPALPAPYPDRYARWGRVRLNQARGRRPHFEDVCARCLAAGGDAPSDTPAERRHYRLLASRFGAVLHRLAARLGDDLPEETGREVQMLLADAQRVRGGCGPGSRGWQTAAEVTRYAACRVAALLTARPSPERAARKALPAAPPLSR